MTDQQLLEQYCQSGSQAAFAELVRRHADWLHSAALRIVQDPELARDVTQAVCLALARKARSLAGTPCLNPWLFCVLRYIAVNALRAQARRKHHEHEAAAMRSELLTASPVPDWQQVASVLDELVESLGGKDRQAVLLRFYQRMSFTQVGAALGISEEAARKRVARATEKLRGRLVRRRIAVPAVVLLSEMLLGQTTQTAPAAVLTLAAGVAAATAPTTAIGLAQGALAMLFYTKLKLIVAAILLLAVSSVVVAQRVLAQPTKAVETAPEARARPALAQSRPPSAPTQRDLDARASFLEVERFARLPQAEQVQQFSAFYRTIAPSHISSVALMILSSFPADLLNRETHVFDPNNYQTHWDQQLQDATAKLTPEQVADNLAISLWLKVASHIRTRALLTKHVDALAVLVKQDLTANDLATVERGCTVIAELRLLQFTPQMLALYLADTPLSKPAYTALVWLRDPATVALLLAEIQKDPKTIIRHAGLFHGPLSDRPAEPQLVKLLDSADPDIRHGAAYALYQCTDATLAQPIAKLATDADPRLPTDSLFLAQRLPGEAFVTIRADLAPLLSSPDQDVRLTAITCFAKHKDLLAGPPILAMLKLDHLETGAQVTIMQALNALAESSFGYDMHNWGPPTNRKAIQEFTGWLEHRDALEVGAGM